MIMARLDIYEPKPRGMEQYLSAYGWHFSSAMAEWAISMMRDKQGKPIQLKDKKSIEELLKTNSMNIDSVAHDIVYVYAMARAKYLGGSISSEIGLLKSCNDYFGDVNGYDGVAFTRFYADCIAKGIPIMWEDML